MTDNYTASIEALIAIFRNRARKLRRNSVFTLLLILIAIGAGFYLFAFAERVVSLSIGSAGIKFHPETKQAPLSNLIPKASIDSSEKIMTKIDNLNRQMKNIHSEISQMRTEQKSSKDTGFNEVISSLATRIGAVFLLIFLVQILVTMYRYQVRLSAYYDARADAIELSGRSDVDSLERIISALSPERIDFGKTPKSPMENSVDLAREVLRLSERK